MKSDIAGALIFAGLIYFEWRLIRSAVKTGEWRHREGVVYRASRPRLFWGIVGFASLGVAFSILILLAILDHKMACGGLGLPGDCYRSQLLALRDWAHGGAEADLETLGAEP